MKIRKLIILNLFIFFLSTIACSTAFGATHQSASQAGATLGQRPGYTAIFAGEPGLVLVFREGATQGQRPGFSALFSKESGQALVTRSPGMTNQHPGYTARFKDTPSTTALVAVQP